MRQESGRTYTHSECKVGLRKVCHCSVLLDPLRQSRMAVDEFTVESMDSLRQLGSLSLFDRVVHIANHPETPRVSGATGPIFSKYGTKTRNLL